MLNRSKHQLLMGQILKDIYTDITIATLLGFKESITKQYQ